MRLRISPTVAWSDSGGRVVALQLSPAPSKPRVLEGTAADIWRFLEQGASTASVVGHMAELFEVGAHEIETDVRSFLEELVASGFAEVTTPSANRPADLR